MRGRVALLALTAVAATLLLPGSADACPVCYGQAEGPMAEAMNRGVLFMLGIVGVVQFGFVAMFVGMWRRNQRRKDHQESLKVINGGIE